MTVSSRSLISLPSFSSLCIEERFDVIGEQLRVLIEEAVIGVRVDAQVGVGQPLGEQLAILVCIMVSLSPTATKVGWTIPARRLSFEASGIPQAVMAASWASRVARSVGASRSTRAGSQGVEVTPEVLQAQQGRSVGLRAAEPAIDEGVSTDLDRPVVGCQLAADVGRQRRPIAAEVVSRAPECDHDDAP
jgi:hypothetical protein